MLPSKCDIIHAVRDYTFCANGCRGSVRRFAWVVAVAYAAGCEGLRAESAPVGMTVLDALPVVSRSGDIYGNGARTPLDLSREISDGSVCWKGRYWEQIGQEKKGELRTVRLSPGGKETVLESEPLDKPIWPKLWPSDLGRFLRLSGRQPASVSRIEFNPKGTAGIVWCGEEKIAVDGRLLMNLSLGSFTNRIARADKIVIRDGGHDCCGAKIDEQPVLLVVTNAAEIAEFNSRLRFAVSDDMGCCACCGHPGIDWGKDGRRIALTSAHHGFALRWCDFPCDMRFDPDSVRALAKLFQDRGLGDHWGK